MTDLCIHIFHVEKEMCPFLPHLDVIKIYKSIILRLSPTLHHWDEKETKEIANQYDLRSYKQTYCRANQYDLRSYKQTYCRDKPI